MFIVHSSRSTNIIFAIRVKHVGLFIWRKKLFDTNVKFTYRFSDITNVIVRCTRKNILFFFFKHACAQPWHCIRPLW